MHRTGSPGRPGRERHFARLTRLANVSTRSLAMTRLLPFWFGFAAAAAGLVACGAENNDVARVDSTGGAGAASPSAAGAPSIGGSSSGGTAGQGGMGGIAGGSGAVVPGPAGPGIACGDATCTLDSEVCCIGGSDPWCDEYQCANATARLECDEAAECPDGSCCFTNNMASNFVVTMCAPDCEAWDSVQICRAARECANGGPCNWFTCPASTAAVTIGLCTATAPWGCE